MNRYIVFDGSDGVGKTTQLQLLVKVLEAKGFNVKVTRAVGGDGSDWIQQQLRALLLSPEFPASRTTDEERIFSLADLINTEQMETFLRSNDNNVVVSDRGFVSHIAYFAAKGHGPHVIGKVHDELFRQYRVLAQMFGLSNVVLVPESAQMVLERVRSRGKIVTPRLENLQMQTNVIEQLRQREDMLAIYAQLATVNIDNRFVEVREADSIEQVHKNVMAALGLK